MRFFLPFERLSIQYKTVVSDFEEHLGQGLGKDAPFVLKFGPWLCIVKEEDLKWKEDILFMYLCNWKSCYKQIIEVIR